jgi:hypothetical protein
METFEIYLIVFGFIATVVTVSIVSLLLRHAMRRKKAAFARILSQLDEMLRQVPQSGYGQLHPDEQDQITQMLMRTHTQLGQFNNLTREHYETQVGNIMGMAANAGIEWTPPAS